MAASLALGVSWLLSQTCKRFLNAKLSPKQYHQTTHLQQLVDGQDEESLIHSAEQWMWKTGTTQLKENLHTLQTELSTWKAHVQTSKPQDQDWNHNIMMQSNCKITVGKENIPGYINRLTDSCHWTSGPTSYSLEVVVQLAFKHLFI